MKLYLVNSQESSLADPDPRVMDGVRSQLRDMEGVRLVSTPTDADAIVLHEAWSFKEWRYTTKLLQDPIVGGALERTYTVNLDDCATGLLKGVYTSLPTIRLDPRIHAIVPYSWYPNEHVLTGHTRERTPPPYLGTWRGNPQSNKKLRRRLLAELANDPRFSVEQTTSWLNHAASEKQHYVELLYSGKFALCPGGWAPITFRIYESMALGIAPVIIADQCGLPSGPSWKDCSIRVRESDLDRIGDLLGEREDDYRDLGSAAREAWWKQFRPEIVFSDYARSLVEVIRGSLGTHSRHDEIGRMQSLRMYWTNRWTVPQRVLNRVRQQVERWEDHLTGQPSSPT